MIVKIKKFPILQESNTIHRILKDNSTQKNEENHTKNELVGMVIRNNWAEIWFKKYLTIYLNFKNLIFDIRGLMKIVTWPSRELIM